MSPTHVFLRRYVFTDAGSLKTLFSDPQVVRYVGDGRTLDDSGAATLFEKIQQKYETDPAFFVWAVEENGEYAGHAELKRRTGRSEYELIYILQRSRWGRSLGGRVADLLLQEARKQAIPFVIATVHPDNAASIAILKRRGFRVDSTLSRDLGCNAYRLTISGPDDD